MKIIFLEAAQSEFDDTLEYYEEQCCGLGFKFAEEVEQALERVNHYPEAWSPLSSRVRRCLLNRFPFSVIYEVRRETITIVGFKTITESQRVGTPELSSRIRRFDQ